MTGRATVLGWKAGWGLVRRLPSGAAYRGFDVAADVLARRGGKSISRLRANYAKVRPDLDDAGLDALVRAGMRSYLRYFCEAFRLPDRTTEELDAMCRAVNDEGVRSSLAAGRSAVIFIAHMGNWDIAGAWSTAHLAPVTTVVERLEPEAVFRDFFAFRKSLGMTILPLTGGPNPFSGLQAAVQRGDFVALAADRDLTSNGLEVDFFGRRARMAKGPALLALLTGAPLYAASIHYAPATAGRGAGGFETVVTFSDEMAVPESGDTTDKVRVMTQACAAYLQGAILEHTADWHMLQRVFVEDLDPARLKV
ncbi:MAG: phosphatidylinositol mannoside acyltransferase [Candidatus Phosphoribacter sp.]